MHILKLEDLTIKVDDKIILDEFNLEIKSGEIHAIMGPNGTGKSTLTKVIMGDSDYKVVKGRIYYDNEDITNLPVDERAKLGIFLGMQMPMEIEGVTNADFLRSALRAKEENNFKLYSFVKKLDNEIEKLKMNKEMVHRNINVGFSGGERKKNEILQMNILRPDVVMLDEIDSGLDVDSLKLIGESVMTYFQEKQPAILLVTHYQRLLDYIKPDFVHIMKNGKIINSGDASLVQIIEKQGYDRLNDVIDCIEEEYKNE